MYRINPQLEEQGRAIALKGESIAWIADQTGMSHMTAWRIYKDVRREFGTIYCACGKVAGHREWCGARMARSPNRISSWLGQLRNIATVNIYVPSRPRYERPEIQNERETEIPLLINRRNVRSLDAAIFDGDECGHTLFKSSALTPLEILLLKEDRESEEFQQRAASIAKWKEWQWRRQSAFSPHRTTNL